VRCGDTHNLKALARDQDWFFVDVDAGPLALSIDGGQTDLDLYIVRNDTEILLRSESGTGVEALTADVTRNQRLQILVNPFADATTAASGPYTLTLTCTAAADTPPPDPTEPDPVDPTPDPVDPVGEGEGEGGSGEGEGEGEGAALNGQLVAPLAAGGCSAGASSDAIAPVALGVFLMARRRRHT
jgi:hypothetical protein